VQGREERGWVKGRREGRSEGKEGKREGGMKKGRGRERGGDTRHTNPSLLTALLVAALPRETEMFKCIAFCCIS